jgi:hypothetical protein
MTEGGAHRQAEALAQGLGITVYVVRNADGQFPPMHVVLDDRRGWFSVPVAHTDPPVFPLVALRRSHLLKSGPPDKGLGDNEAPLDDL